MDSSPLTPNPFLPAPGRSLLQRIRQHELRPARWFRRHFWKIGVWTFTVLTLAWQYENWYGRNFLAEERARWIAEYGDITQLPAFLPATPDDSNFFAAPVFETFVIKSPPLLPSPDAVQAAYNQKVRTLTEALPHARFLHMAFPPIDMAPGTVQEKVIAPGLSLPDFAAWAQSQEKAGLTRPAGMSDAAWLNSLMPEDQTVDGLVAALSRPDSEILPSAAALSSIGEQTEDPAAIPIPALSGYYKNSVGVALRARAAAPAGDGRTARDLCEILLRFAEGTSRSRSLIMMLVGTAVEGEALKAISAGIAAQCWKNDDLLHLANRLERLDEEKLIRRGLYSEVFWLHRQQIEKTRSWFRRVTQFPISGTGLENFFPSITVHGPAGWIDSNLANHLHQWRTMLTPDVPGDDLVHLNDKMKQGLAGNRDWYAQPPTPRDLFAKILMPQMSGIPLRALQNQTLRRQLLLALAAERYLLQNKTLPSHADQLIPGSIPAIPGDPWSPGRPLYYQTGVTGERYRLVSIGPEAVLAFPSSQL